MKDHIPTIAMLSALAVILAALVVLALCWKNPEVPVLLALSGAAASMAGAIGGFSMNSSKTPNEKDKTQ